MDQEHTEQDDDCDSVESELEYSVDDTDEPRRVFLSLTNHSSAIDKNQIQRAFIHANGNMDLFLLNGSIVTIEARTMEPVWDDEDSSRWQNLRRGDALIAAMTNQQGSFVRLTTLNDKAKEGPWESERERVLYGWPGLELDFGKERKTLSMLRKTHRLLSIPEEEHAGYRLLKGQRLITSYFERADNTKVPQEPKEDKVIVHVEAGLLQACENLVVVEFADPASVVLGAGFCKDCPSLCLVKLPDLLMTIPPKAFLRCRSLSKINWTTSLQTVGAQAFVGCVLLPMVKLPKGFGRFDKNAFDTNLTHMILPPMDPSMLTLGPQKLHDFDNQWHDTSTRLSSDLIHVWSSSFGKHNLWRTTSYQHLAFYDIDFTKWSEWRSFCRKLMAYPGLKDVCFDGCKLDPSIFLEMIHSLRSKALSLYCFRCYVDDNVDTVEFLRQVCRALPDLDLESFTLFGASFTFNDNGTYIRFESLDATLLDEWSKILQQDYRPQNITRVVFHGCHLNYSRPYQILDRIIPRLLEETELKAVSFEGCYMNKRLLCDSLKLVKAHQVKAKNMEFIIDDCEFTDDHEPFSFFDSILPLPVSGTIDTERLLRNDDGNIHLFLRIPGFDSEPWSQWILKERDARISSISCCEAGEWDSFDSQMDCFLSDIIAKSDCLECLAFQESELSMTELPRLAAAIKKHKKLKEFHLYNCNCRDLGSSGVLSDLFRHPLEFLTLSAVDKGCCLPRILEELVMSKDSTLTTLQLKDCDLNDHDASCLLIALEHNKTLTTLDLSCNPMTFPCHSTWTIHEQNTLRHLTIPSSCAQFFVDAVDAVDVEVNDAQNLKHLNQSWWEQLSKNWSLFSLEVDDGRAVPFMMQKCLERNRFLERITSGVLDCNFPMTVTPNLLSKLCFPNQETLIYAFLERYITNLTSQRSSSTNKKRPIYLTGEEMWRRLFRQRKST